MYAFLDTRKPGKYRYGKYTFEYEPFYIGKGCGNRSSVHFISTNEKNRNPYKTNKINKIIRATKKRSKNYSYKMRHKRT